MGHGDGVHALAAAMVLGVLLDLRALAVALLGDDEEVGAGAGDFHAQHVGVGGHVHAAHAHGAAAHGAGLGLVPQDGLAGGGHHDDLLARRHALHGDELVIVLQVDGDEAVAAGAVVLVHGGLLHVALSRGEHEELLGREVLRGDDGADRLAFLQRQQVHDGRAAGMAAGLGNLVHLQAIHLALGGEEQHVGVGGGHEQVLHEVGVLQVHALHALAAALLLAVGAHGQALDVAGLGHGDDHVLLSDEVFHLDILRFAGDAGSARGAVLLLDLQQLVLNDLLQQVLVGQDLLVVGDLLAQLGQLFLDLLALQTGEAAQAHFQDGVGLLLGEAEALSQLRARFLVGLGRADDLNDLVDVVERDDVALEDVLALLGLGQLVAGAAGDDVLLVLDVVEEDFLQGQHARGAVHQGQHVGAEAHLQLGVLVQLVQHHLRDGVGLQVDDDIDALAVGGVVDVADFRQLLVAHQLAELLQQALAVHLVGNLLHHDGGAAVLLLLDLALGADGHVAVAGLVGVQNALLAHDEAAGGEVRAGHDGQQLLGGDLGIVDHEAGGVDGLAQVVGRDVRGHADGDAVGPVHQQVGEAGRQHRGLLQALVVVGLEVDGLLVQVAQQFHGRLVQAGLGVTHGGGTIAVDGTEVAVAVDEGQAQAEGLGQAHHGVVHGGVTMGMVLADDVADGTGRLHVGLARGVARLVHGVQDAAVHRLQAVAHVGQGAGHDNGHGVFQEGGLHLFTEEGRANRGALAAVGPRDDGAVGVRHVHHHGTGPFLLGDGVELGVLLVQGGGSGGHLGVLVALVIGVDLFGQVELVLLGGLYLVALVGVEVLVFKICHWFPFLKKLTGLVRGRCGR